MTHHDLIIIGTGSANSIPGPENEHLSIGIVEAGVFGGTCLNVGCIPTKMYVYPAEVARAAREAAELGLTFGLPRVDWTGIRDRIFRRIDAIAEGGRDYRVGPETPNITTYLGEGRFVGHKTMEVNYPDGRPADTLTADTWVLGAGGRPYLPAIPGLVLGSRVHTSDTIMRIDALPERIVIVGGGFIAAEFAHVFSSLGSEVVQINRSPMLLRHHDGDISRRFTEVAGRMWEVRAGQLPVEVRANNDGVVLVCQDGSEERFDQMLVAAGRRTNADRLNLQATGVEVDEHGKVQVDEYQRTNVEAIWALGDLSSPYELKHVANHEMRVVKHNLAHPNNLRRTNHHAVPSAVFTHPQIASVGATEEQLQEAGTPYRAASQDYGATAYGWAREDTTGFAKILIDPDTKLILGAHIIGPEAATVIQPLIQAMALGTDALTMATDQYWIHPAMPEVVENCLLKFQE